MDQFTVSTGQRTQWIEITDQVQQVVSKRWIEEGLCVVYCPHTTAAVTINENADPDVVHDALVWLNEHIPKDHPQFRHGEGNSDAHIKAALVGPSVMLLVAGGRLALGRWQGVYLCEFDGPRSRQLWVQAVGATVNGK